MSHRIVETLIGRLITDDEFRSDFLQDPGMTLIGLRERGLELTSIEIAALVATDPTAWTHASDALDPRLKKASLSAT